MFAETLPDVYTPREIADAAGVPEPVVRNLITRGEIRSVLAMTPVADAQWADLVTHTEAVRAVRSLKANRLTEAPAAVVVGERMLSTSAPAPREATMPLLVSTSLHVLVGAALLVIASLDLTRADERTDPIAIATRADSAGLSGDARSRRRWWRRWSSDEDPAPESAARGATKNEQPDPGAPNAASARAAEAPG